MERGQQVWVFGGLCEGVKGTVVDADRIDTLVHVDWTPDQGLLCFTTDNVLNVPTRWISTDMSKWRAPQDGDIYRP